VNEMDYLFILLLWFGFLLEMWYIEHKLEKIKEELERIRKRL